MMHWDYALIAVLLFMNAVFMSALVNRFAKNKTDNQLQPVFTSFLLSLVVFPLGWIHCWYWSKRLPDKGFIKLG